MKSMKNTFEKYAENYIKINWYIYMFQNKIKISFEEFNETIFSFYKYEWNPDISNNYINKDNKIIVLIGMTGSGKSSYGEFLSSGCRMVLYDTDKIIEKMNNMSIKDIFKYKGEDEFRKLEEEVLSIILNKNKGCIISLGGGTFMNKNIQLLCRNNKNVEVKHLCERRDIIWERIKDDDKRPLVKQGKEYFDKVYNERVSLYNKLADETIRLSLPYKIKRKLVIKGFDFKKFRFNYYHIVNKILNEKYDYIKG